MATDPHTSHQSHLHFATKSIAAIIGVIAVIGVNCGVYTNPWGIAFQGMCHMSILTSLSFTTMAYALYRLASQMPKSNSILIGTLLCIIGTLYITTTALKPFNLSTDANILEPIHLIDTYTPLASGVCFILSGILLLTHSRFPTTRINLYDAILTGYLILPLLSVFSFIFNPGMNITQHSVLTMPVLSGLSFLLFFFGLSMQTYGKGAAGLLTRNTHTARTFRALSFFVLVVPLCFGSVLNYAVEHRFLNAGFAAAIFCLFSTLLITISLAHSAILQEHWFKKLKKERKKSNMLQAQIHELLDISHDGLILFDEGLKILHSNTGASRILGWTGSDLEKLTLLELIPEDSRERQERLIRRFIQNKTQHSFDIPGNIFALTRENKRIPLTVTLSKKSTGNQILTIAILKSMEIIHEQMDFLQRRATLDPLTNTLNRSAFEDYCQRLGPSASRKSDGLFSIIVLDLDHFKQVNDQYGHDVGDQALRCCADAIRTSLREGDKLFRIGGEEFVVIAQHTVETDVHVLAERIRGAVKSTPIITSAISPFFVTCSLGICITDLKNMPIKDALKVADEAMYKAKQLGRDRAIFNNSAIRQTSLPL